MARFPAYIVSKELADKEFSVSINNELSINYCDLLFNVDDYNEITGNYRREMSQIMFSSQSFGLKDFNAVTALANEVFGHNITTDGKAARLEYLGDYLDTVINDYEYMNLIRIYIMIALFIVFVLIILVLGYNTISVLVTAKSKDLLIIKSLGANKWDYFKIYGIVAILQLVIELVLGIGIGLGVLIAFNQLLTTLLLPTLAILLPIAALPIISIVLIVSATELLSLLINILKINDKNLRKSFQKVND